MKLKRFIPVLPFVKLVHAADISFEKKIKPHDISLDLSNTKESFKYSRSNSNPKKNNLKPNRIDAKSKSKHT